MAVKFGAGCGVVSHCGKTPSSEPGLSAAPPAGKFDLLMDAELDVTLRFGKKSMLLREIMEQDAGAVVELDRQVQEPVDLLLAGVQSRVEKSWS
jgi:flagellar motor switch/type III secretory pathway protein FliN